MADLCVRASAAAAADFGSAARGRRAFLLGAGALLGFGRAAALDPPAGPTVLTLRGRVRNTNDADAAHFDMPMLEALPQSSFSTRTPWYPQPRRFTGPLLRDVLAAAGAHGRLLKLGALNDYRVDMPVEDAERHDVIVARLLDDRPMAVRDKGPLFVIYPFDARAELRSAVYYGRSAWQLRTIDVQ
jgi:hypothetical protein